MVGAKRKDAYKIYEQMTHLVRRHLFRMIPKYMLCEICYLFSFFFTAVPRWQRAVVEANGQKRLKGRADVLSASCFLVQSLAVLNVLETFGFISV